MFFEITLVILVAISLRAIFIMTLQGDDNWVHLWFIQKNRNQRNLSDFSVNNSLISGVKAKPQLYYYLISLLPKKYWVIGSKIFNIILDCIVITCSILISYYLFLQIGTVENTWLFKPSEYVGLLLATSPLLLPSTARMKVIGARVFGFFLYFFFIICNALLLLGYPIIGSIGSALVLILILLSSQFALQVSIWTSVILSIGFLNPLSIGTTFLCLVCAYINNKLGTRDILQHKIAHWIWYFRNSQTGTPVTGKNNIYDLLRLPVLLFKDYIKAFTIISDKSVIIKVLYSALPLVLILFFVGCDPWIIKDIIEYPVTRYLFWVIVASVSACVLTSLPHLLFLGEAERYLEYSMPAIVCLFVYSIHLIDKSEYWAMYIVLLQIIGVIFNYLVNFFKAYQSIIQGQVEKSFQELIVFLANRESLNILTVPTKMSYRISSYLTNNHCYYYRGINNPKEGFLYMEKDNVAFDLPKNDFFYFNNQYGINTIIFSKKTLKSCNKKNILYNFSEYPIMFENEDYIIINIS